LSAADAEILLRSGAPLADHRHQMTGALAGAAWAMRQNLSFYHALYVALTDRAPLQRSRARLGAFVATRVQIGCLVPVCYRSVLSAKYGAG
jgi:hypothetical protein